MVSILRTLQSDWNALVPAATALGIRRVRVLGNGNPDMSRWPLETIEYRRNKLDWLRGEIARLGGATQRAQSTTSLTPVQEQDLSVLTFGVELELLMPRGINHATLASRIDAHTGIPCYSEGYNHNNVPHWKVVTDGSLGDYSRGAEVVSPVLRGAHGFDQLNRICQALKAIGCTVTKKCGLHVHVGAQGWSVDTVKNLVALYHSAEGTIDAFMAPSRRGSQGGNGFCGSIRLRPQMLRDATTWDTVAQAIGQTPGRHNARGGGRYCKLNLQSYWQHGTVEFRHHQGTVEADKAVNWVKTCLRMALAAQDGVHAAASHEEFFAVIKSPSAEAAFFASRRDFFITQATRTMRNSMLAQARREAGRNTFEEVGNDLQTRSTTRNQY